LQGIGRFWPLDCFCHLVGEAAHAGEALDCLQMMLMMLASWVLALGWGQAGRTD